jgi:uncharacterized protein YgiM (DUF1202 family)
MNVSPSFRNIFLLFLVALAPYQWGQLVATNTAPTSVTATSFTGKIKGNKVRIRLEPGVDSPVLHELSAGDMVVVTGEQNDFFAIRPPKGLKAFVYRTYVIDDIVEGNRVNIRAEPSLEAPVLAQLNKGDKIDGHVSPLNTKWLQIALPDQVRFYIASEYVENIGDANLLARIEQRRAEATQTVDHCSQALQAELRKPYNAMNLSAITDQLQHATEDYSDVPEERERALKLLTEAHENHLQKRLEHLQSQATTSANQWQNRCKRLADEMTAQQAHLEALERSLHSRKAESIPPPPQPRELAEETLDTYEQQVATPAVASAPIVLTESMSDWLPQEDAVYRAWLREHPNDTMEQFYTAQLEHSSQVRGTVQAYRRAIRNKPGNFLLVDQQDEIPIAFLYSTRVNLDALVGETITLRVAPRPENNFAFPAWFVLDSQ